MITHTGDTYWLAQVVPPSCQWLNRAHCMTFTVAIDCLRDAEVPFQSLEHKVKSLNRGWSISSAVFTASLIASVAAARYETPFICFPLPSPLQSARWCKLPPVMYAHSSKHCFIYYQGVVVNCFLVPATLSTTCYANRNSAGHEFQ